MFKNAFSPVTPAFIKSVVNEVRVCPDCVKLLCNLLKSKLPVFTFIAFPRCICKSLAALEAALISSGKWLPTDIEDISAKFLFKSSRLRFATDVSAVNAKFTFNCLAIIYVSFLSFLLFEK